MRVTAHVLKEATLIMELLKGPFGSWNGFLSLVALDNCAEYFLRDKAAKEEPTSDRASENRVLARLLFNAVVSLDSVVDYWCHESDPPLESDEFLRSVPELYELRQVANALKHCVRGQGRGSKFRRATDKKHASHQASAHVVFDIAMSGPAASVVGVAYEFSLDQKADAALTAAWHYWMARVP